ncbi:MAG: hypothetical protein RBS84_09785 [Kiritimatiellia bacterium]|jgi:hypothetical protein|nr:hypothetical protein [Kiritimatiellia bacterium]
MKGSDTALIGCAWYSRNQWALLKASSVDSEHLESTYDEWLRYAAESFEKLKNEGCNICKVEIDVEDLIEWCRSKMVPLDGAARSQYAAEMARIQDTE